jgi:hypothetical protein
VSPRKAASLDDYEDMMGRGSPNSSAVDANFDISTTSFPSLDVERERDEKEVFSQIKKPRVRYDVEVVTKMVVYAGM